MPKINANNLRLFVDNGSGTFNVVAGQISTNIDRGEVSFATVDKASTIETSDRAMRNYQITTEIKPDLPDANGYTRIETLYASGAGNAYQVRKAPYGVGDVVFACTNFRVSSMPSQMQLNDAASGSIVLVPATGATVTTDALS